jgi:hypothetical protein
MSSMNKQPTLGQLIADAIFDAKKAGVMFSRDSLATEADRVHADWLKLPKFELEPECPKSQIPPTPNAVTYYSQSIGYPLNGDEFCDFYAQKGWVVGKAKMRDWQATVRNWKRENWGRKITATSSSALREKSRDYQSI